jgi:thiol-disulfide isomerase/thioredoxin
VSSASLPSLPRRSFLLSAASAAFLPAAFAAPPASAPRAGALPDFGAAPEFAGIERWLNSEPLSMARLRSRVVLVDFWTYACVNCVRTLPHVNRWAARYEAEGLTVVGVHTPEFPFERSASNLEAAIRRLGVRHAVAQDNRYATWKAYDNQYWPATYLVDARGRIRYKHFGEGEYERTESVIQALLAARRDS